MARGRPKKIRVRAGRGTIAWEPERNCYRAEVMVEKKRYRKRFSTEEEAQSYLETVVRKADRAVPIETGDITWAEVTQMFLRSKELEGLEKSTLQNYRNTIRYCSTWDSTPIGRLRISDVEDLLNTMKEGITRVDKKGKEFRRKMSAVTIGDKLGMIQAIFRFAVDREYIERNVAARVKPPAVRRRIPVVLPEPQVRSFLTALAGEPLESLFWLILSTGVRKGEAIALKWDDIDVNTGKVTIRRKIVRLMGEAVIGDAKSDAGVRVVQLPATALEKLLLWQKRQQLQKKMATWTEGGWVFTHGSGKWVEPRWVNKKLAELLKKSDLSYVTVHQLRHTFATLLLSKGVPVKDVQEILGHSKASTTMDMYYQSIPGASGRVSKKVEEILGGGAGQPKTESP